MLPKEKVQSITCTKECLTNFIMRLKVEAENLPNKPVKN